MPTDRFEVCWSCGAFVKLPPEGNAVAACPCCAHHANRSRRECRCLICRRDRLVVHLDTQWNEIFNSDVEE